MGGVRLRTWSQGIGKAESPFLGKNRQPAAAVTDGVGNQIPVHPAQGFRIAPSRHILPVKPQVRHNPRRLQLGIKLRQRVPEGRQDAGLPALQRQGAALQAGVEKQLLQQFVQLAQPLLDNLQIFLPAFRLLVQQLEIPHCSGQGGADVVGDTGHRVFQLLLSPQRLQLELPPRLQPRVYRPAQPPGDCAGHPHRQGQIALRRSFLQNPSHFQHLGAIGPQPQQRGAQGGQSQNQNRQHQKTSLSDVPLFYGQQSPDSVDSDPGDTANQDDAQLLNTALGDIEPLYH